MPKLRLSVAPDFGAAVELVCAGAVELLDEGFVLLLLAVVDMVVSVFVEEFAVVEVKSVVLLIAVSEEVSVIMAVGRVELVGTMAVTGESVGVVLGWLVLERLSVIVEAGVEIMEVEVVEGIAEGRMMGALVVVALAVESVGVELDAAAVVEVVVLSAAAVVETVVPATGTVVEVVESPFGTGIGT